MKRIKFLAAVGILVVLTVLLFRICHVGSDIELIVTPKESYYPDLPIVVDYTVNNRGSKDAYVWSVGFGSGAIVPGYMLTSEGKPVPFSQGSRMRSRRMVMLPAGGKMTGSINISSWMAPTNGVTGKEFLPGDYSIFLYYQYGTNQNDVVSSTNVIIHIVEPDNALKEKREIFRRVSNEFNNSIPQVITEDLRRENPSDCYTTTALNLYATWLTSVKRYDEALEVYQKILYSGHNEYKVCIKMGVAYCYLFLKKEEDARRILEELKPEHDEAFWLLRTLDKKQEKPVDPLIEK